jgi:GlpG protein
MALGDQTKENFFDVQASSTRVLRNHQRCERLAVSRQETPEPKLDTAPVVRGGVSIGLRPGGPARNCSMAIVLGTSYLPRGMRLIGYLENESLARTFTDYLYVQGIENQLEFQKDEGWGIWIRDEDKLDPAAKLLTSFRENPRDPRYHTEAQNAAQLRLKEEKEDAAYRKKLRGGRHLFRPLSAYGFGPLTFGLIVICVAVFVFSKFATDLDAIRGMFISEHPGHRDLASMLPEVRQGQIWRLFTPAFIHLGWLHILFNMLWLRDLGSMIEARQGNLHLAILVLVIAACSNFGQYYVSGPIFGGMSGVVYGLLGYIWMRGKFDPGSGLFLHPSTVNMMLIWFVLCYTGLLGPVANTAHAVGLVLGIAWGYLSSLSHR